MIDELFKKETEYGALRIQNIKLKQVIARALEYIEYYKFDYEVKQRGFYMVQSVVPEFRLTEILKGQMSKEQFANLINGDYIEEKKKTLEEEFEEYNKRKKIDRISTYYDDNLCDYVAKTYINEMPLEEVYNPNFEKLLIDKINEIIDKLNEANDE